MKFEFKNIFILLLFSVAFLQCKSNKKEVNEANLPAIKSNLVYLDKAAAEVQICQDKTDGFFESLLIEYIYIPLKKSDLQEAAG